MTFKKSHIFRPEAVAKYRERQYEAVFPRFLLPRTFLFLWLLLGLLLFLGVLAWFAEVPQFVTGQAVVVAGEAMSGEGRLVILVPGAGQRGLRTGQAVYTPVAAISIEEIQAVKLGVLSPAAATAKYDLPPGLITAPTAIAFTSFQTKTLSAEQYRGSLYPVHIQVGSQRLITKIPFVGQLLGELDERF